LCPFCGEKFKNENDGCKHCGYNYKPSGVAGILNEMEIRLPKSADKYEEDDWQGKNTGYASKQGSWQGKSASYGNEQDNLQGNNAGYGSEQNNWQGNNAGYGNGQNSLQGNNASYINGQGNSTGKTPIVQTIQDWCNLNTNETSRKVILVLLTFFAPVLGLMAGFVFKPEKKEQPANQKTLIIIIVTLLLIMLGLIAAIVVLSIW